MTILNYIHIRTEEIDNEQWHIVAALDHVISWLDDRPAALVRKYTDTEGNERSSRRLIHEKINTMLILRWGQ